MFRFVLFGDVSPHCCRQLVNEHDDDGAVRQTRYTLQDAHHAHKVWCINKDSDNLRPDSACQQDKAQQ